MQTVTDDRSALWRRSDSLADFEATMSGLLRPCRAQERRGARYRTEVLHDRIGGVGLTAVRTGGAARITVEPDRALSLLQIPIHGAFDSHAPRQESERYEAGAAAQLVDASAPLELDFHAATRMLIVDLAPEQLEALGGSGMARARGGRRRVSLESPAGARLLRLSRFLLAEIEAQPLDHGADALAEGLEQALIAAVGGALDHSAAPEPAASVVAAGDGGPLDRAERFMRAHLDQPVTPAEIAAAAGVSLRSLHRLFRARRGATPLAVFKEMRLERVHREIVSGRCKPNGLTALALDWGFNHAGLFAADYRRKFGQAPSETLRARAAGSSCGYML
ncbi:AraC family transcriptional regulator [Rhodovulum sp. DZ06]|uniref:helix-turn-helix transcriptional regulator n=1 Tax=Rhodovulum sp. DZ06 TaxID=3425126 RepID=UPI003D332C85